MKPKPNEAPSMRDPKTQGLAARLGHLRRSSLLLLGSSLIFGSAALLARPVQAETPKASPAAPAPAPAAAPADKSAPTASAANAANAADDKAELKALLTNVDDLFRGQGSHAKISMHVKTKHFERSMTIEAWSKGTKRSLMRILAPAKEKGVTTLKVDDNLWNYLPKVDRTIKIPASMMSGSWMGSHFTNDDLVRESRFDQDFDAKISKRPAADGSGEWILVLIPKPDTPVVWGRIETHVDGHSRLPTKVVYFDEAGEKVRTMTYHDLKTFSGRTIPSRMKLVPEEAPEEFTEIVYEALELNQDVPDKLFSKRALKR